MKARYPNESPEISSPPPIEEIDAMILSRLDERSYDRAVLRDADYVLDTFLFPMNFLWHNPTIPLGRLLPKDIDELPGITSMDQEVVSPYGEKGIFGYGRYESGRSLAQRGIGQTAARARHLVAGHDKTFAAARRSRDPGVQELAVIMPPPHAVDASLSPKHDLKRLRASIEAERAEASSSMPLYWEKGDGKSYFNPPAFSSSSCSRSFEEEDSQTEDEYSRYWRDQQEKKAQTEMVKKCTRSWNISLKIASVSSRSTLFGECSTYQREESETVAEGSRDKSKPDNNRKKIHYTPMLSFSSFPASIQQGTSVSIERAKELDEYENLGSYDCGVGNPPYISVEKNASGKRKKVLVGRTRLVWSNIENSAGLTIASQSRTNVEYTSSGRNRFVYTSILNGQKLDNPSYKRPRDVKVGVRLNGNLLIEKTEGPPTRIDETPNPSRRKTSHRAKGEEEYQLPIWPVHSSRSDKVIESAISMAQSQEKESPLNSINLARNRKSSIESSYGIFNATCTLDSTKLLSTMFMEAKSQNKAKMSSNGRRQKKVSDLPETHETDPPSGQIANDPNLTTSETCQPFISMRFGATNMLKHTPPRFDCLPLDDGPIRVVCTYPGIMAEASIHLLLNQVSKKNQHFPLCTVCWTENTHDKKVEECVDCGLLVHADCCYDRGNHISDESEHNGKWRCSVCHDGVTKTNIDSSLPKKKSRRSPKLPFRFSGCLMPQLSVRQEGPKNCPNHKCTLCPHRGGAMSRLCNKNNGEDSAGWTHEVCRLWCSFESKNNEKEEENQTESKRKKCLPLLSASNTCSLCGRGDDTIPETRSQKEIDATKHEEAIKNENGTKRSPLVKCSAHGCYVHFHPFCALLVTKLKTNTTNPESKRDKHHDRSKKSQYTTISDEVEHMKEKDFKLCSEYTLDILELSSMEGTFGSLPGENKSRLVPVSFCGLHNPKRERSLFGCPVAGGIVASTMQIPTQDF
eukprot:scaffold20492_cov56-Attheya_sp.AAC.3